MLSKTDYLQFLECPKSLWLLKNRPALYPESKSSAYDEKLSREGYEFQKLVQDLIIRENEGANVSFEKPFSTEDGLYAVADIVIKNINGKLDIYEVKSSTKVENSHLSDAAFQTITVGDAGSEVGSIYIVHLNGDYIHSDQKDVKEMVSFSLVTAEVKKLITETRSKIEQARSLLNKKRIEEDSCSCLYLSRSHHCSSFSYFNKNIPSPSIYDLPRIHKNKIKTFVSEKRFSLDCVDEHEVSERQQLVLQSAKSLSPIVDKRFIHKFFSRIKYPLFFLDYETYSSAIPIVKGAKPHSHIPFQFSVHRLQSQEDQIDHFEYLAETAELPLKFLIKLEDILGKTGSVISWHKSFENTRNKEMAKIYPQKREFLMNLIDRTIDLENIFKSGYVDIGFKGSTSIKKVLPIIVPSLSYEDMAVSNGTDAMLAFAEMIKIKEKRERQKIRSDMLAYCKLDTLAMLEIYKKIKMLI